MEHLTRHAEFVAEATRISLLATLFVVACLVCLRARAAALPTLAVMFAVFPLTSGVASYIALFALARVGGPRPDNLQLWPWSFLWARYLGNPSARDV